MNERTEMTVHGERVYMHPDRLAAVKAGETYNLDRAGMTPQTSLVAFDGMGPTYAGSPTYRWRRERDGRVWLYTADQCERNIYYLRPGPPRMSLSDACSVIESVAGFTDETTPTGEAWSIVKTYIVPHGAR